MVIRRRIEAAAFAFVLLLAAFIFVLSLNTIKAIDSGDPSQNYVAQQEHIAAILLNLSSELVGACVIYVVFRLIFRFPEEQPQEQQEATPPPSHTHSEPMPSETMRQQRQKPQWKKPLKGAVMALILDGQIDANGIGIFRQFKLPDGTPLLAPNEVRELRDEWAKANKQSSEIK